MRSILIMMTPAALGACAMGVDGTAVRLNPTFPAMTATCDADRFEMFDAESGAYMVSDMAIVKEGGFDVCRIRFYARSVAMRWSDLVFRPEDRAEGWTEMVTDVRQLVLTSSDEVPVDSTVRIEQLLATRAGRFLEIDPDPQKDIEGNSGGGYAGKGKGKTGKGKTGKGKTGKGKTGKGKATPYMLPDDSLDPIDFVDGIGTSRIDGSNEYLFAFEYVNNEPPDLPEDSTETIDFAMDVNLNSVGPLSTLNTSWKNDSEIYSITIGTIDVDLGWFKTAKDELTFTISMLEFIEFMAPGQPFKIEDEEDKNNN